jgi:monoamine oxidase
MFRLACLSMAPQSSAPVPGPRLRRRRFLKYTALAAAGAIAAAVPNLQATGQSAPTVAIIGGGLAGLAAAYRLQNMGITATIYEAKPRVGGRVQSVNNVVGDGLVVEMGAEFINTDHRDLLALVAELNLPLFNVQDAIAQSAWPATAYYLAGQTWSEEELVNAFRPMAAQLIEDAQRLEDDWDFYAPMFDRLSVTDYLDLHGDRLTHTIVRYLLEATIRSEYGVEPQDSSALQLLFNLPAIDEGDRLDLLSASDETYTVVGGTEQIVTSLRERLADQIQVNKRLVGIQRPGRPYRLLFADATVVDAAVVIVAMPFPALRDVDLQVSLPPDFRRFINEGQLGLNEKLILGFQHRAWQQERGFSGTAWVDAGFTAAWDATQRQPAQSAAALTCFMGGLEVEASRGVGPQILGDAFTDRLASVLPDLPAARSDRAVRTYWYNDYLVKGGYSSFRPGQYTEFGQFMYVESNIFAERQQPAFGNLIFAGEHLSDAYYGYMNGAVETGRLAAEIAFTRLTAG